MAKHKTLEDFLEDWLRHASIHLREKTARSYYGTTKRFVAAVGMTKPRELSKRVIQPYIDRLSERYKPNTIKSIQCGIWSFCEYLVDMEILMSNPARQIKTPTIYLEPPVFLTEKEMRRAIVLAGLFGISFEVKFALATGPRCDEMKNLLWENVHLKEMFLEVRKGKGSKSRTVPIMDSILEDLEILYQPSGYVFSGRFAGTLRSTGVWYYYIVKLQKKMPKITGWHIFRHTFASLLIQHGVPLEKISKWLGHRNIQTTLDYYANACPDNYDEAINQFPGLKTTVPSDNWNNLKCVAN